MKRFLIILLSLLLLLPCLAACKPTPGPGPEETTPEQEQTPEAPATLDLVLDGASDYVIVRPADLRAEDPAFKAAVLLRDAIEKLTGVTLQIVTDNEADYAAAEKEILIGNARGTQYGEHAVTVQNGKLCIGGEAQLLSEMVAALFASCFEVDIHADEVKTMKTLSVPADLTMDQAGNITSVQVKEDKTAWGDSITYADEVANLINFRYLDQRRDVAEITNGDVRLVYNLEESENKQVAGLYNTQGVAYLTNSMDAFVVTGGDTLYASQSGVSARGNIYRFGYYYYDIHFLDQGFLPSTYEFDESAGSYNMLTKARKPSSHDIESVGMVDGVLTAIVGNTNDPYFHWSIKYDAEDYNAVQITMRTEYASTVQLYLYTEAKGYFNSDQLTSFSVKPGEEYCTVIVPLTTIPDYTGRVEGIRVDCGSKMGEKIEIKEMKAVKINTTAATTLRLDRNYHVYGDKLHQQIRIVANGDTEGLQAFGTVTRIEKSRVASLVIADKNGKHSTIEGIDAGSVEYVGFDIKDAGVFGYIFPAETEYAGKVTVTAEGEYYVITQTYTPKSTSLKSHDSYSIGHRIYTDESHSFDELERQAYIERNPLSNIKIVTQSDGAKYAGYNSLVGCYTFTLNGTDFNKPYYKEPQKHYIVDAQVTGDDYDRAIYVFAHTNNTGCLENGVVLSENDQLLPINVEVCKNFKGEYEEKLFDPEDMHYGYSIFPITVSKNQTRRFKSINLYQNWGQVPLKQLSSIQFIAPYYHLSCGTTETNCIAPYYVYGKDYWTLPDFRAMSSPLWPNQPQHTSAGRLYWLQYTDAQGNFYGSESQTADISSSGPVYVDIDMSYLSDDGKIQVDYRQVEMAQSDETRTYYTLNLTVLEDLEIKDFVNNFSFFSMDGRAITYKKFGYLDENNNPQTVELNLNSKHTDYYKLGTNGAYFDYYIDSDPSHSGTDSVNMAVLIKDYSMIIDGKAYDGNLVLKETYDGAVNLATLTANLGDVTLRAGDTVRIDMILLPWGYPESKDDSNVLKVREDSVLSAINTKAQVGTVIADTYLPTVMADNNVAEFTVSGGGSAIYAVRVYGFDTYTKPNIQVLENGQWVDFKYQYHDYDGYMSFREDDGTYSLAFSFEMKNGEARTFRVTQ